MNNLTEARTNSYLKLQGVGICLLDHLDSPVDAELLPGVSEVPTYLQQSDHMSAEKGTISA